MIQHVSWTFGGFECVIYRACSPRSMLGQRAHVVLRILDFLQTEYQSDSHEEYGVTHLCHRGYTEGDLDNSLESRDREVLDECISDTECID